MTRLWRIPGIVPLACLAMVGACRAAGNAEERPAMLAAPTPQVISTLAHTVSKALGGRHVLLAPDALMHTSELIIEPAPQRSLQGRIESGRTQAMPDKFHLIMHADKCILIQDRGGRRFELRGAHCRPAPP